MKRGDALRFDPQSSDNKAMNWVIAQFWCLFIVALTLQLVAISVRHIFVSLFFSLLHSILISVVLFAMGNPWIGLAHLWFSAGICYFSLIQTSILLGSQKTKRFKRRINFSLFVYIIAVAFLFYLSIRLFPHFESTDHFTPIMPGSTVSAALSSDHGLVVLTIAFMALSSLVSVYLLVRRDDVLTKRDY